MVSGALANRLKGLCETIRSKNIELTSSNGVKDVTTHSKSGGCPTFANCLVSVSNDGLGLVQVYKQGETSDVNDGGSGNYTKYDREGAVEYALAHAEIGKSINIKGYELVILKGNYNSEYIGFDYIVDIIKESLSRGVGTYGGDCANFVSQSLYEGGNIPQDDEWKYERTYYDIAPWYYNDYSTVPQTIKYVDEDGNIKNDYKYDEFTAAWVRAEDQYEYFSNPDNGYINGNPITINPTDDIPSIIQNNNIQEGDLLYWAGSDGTKVHHATIITKITDSEINYSGHTNSANNKPLSDAIIDNGETVIIIRMNDYIKE